VIRPRQECAKTPAGAAGASAVDLKREVA
jgi:hypothetical protein